VWDGDTCSNLLGKSTVAFKPVDSLLLLGWMTVSKNLSNALVQMNDRKFQPAGTENPLNALLLGIPPGVENDFKTIDGKLRTIRQNRLVAARIRTATKGAC